MPSITIRISRTPSRERLREAYQLGVDCDLAYGRALDRRAYLSNSSFPDKPATYRFARPIGSDECIAVQLMISRRPPGIPPLTQPAVLISEVDLVRGGLTRNLVFVPKHIWELLSLDAHKGVLRTLHPFDDVEQNITGRGPTEFLGFVGDTLKDVSQ